MHENNVIKVSGRIVDKPLQSHRVYDETFYKFEIKVKRLSQIEDILPVTIPEHLFDERLVPEKFINIKGQIRSYNTYSQTDGKTKLILTLFARHIDFEQEHRNRSEITDKDDNTYTYESRNFRDGLNKFFIQNDCDENPNEVFLNGYICKKPIYRKTPFGREITDILLAVNRSYNKSDYIPCIAWGRNAKFAAQLNIADNVKVYGRMQSRRYQKKLVSGEQVDKIAYELSVAKIELSQEQENEEK